MPVVEYVDNYVRKGAVYLRSFAAWAELVQPESKQWSDAMLEYMQLCKQIVETNYDTEVPAMQARMRELHPLLTQQEAARVNRTIFRL